MLVMLPTEVPLSHALGMDVTIGQSRADGRVSGKREAPGERMNPPVLDSQTEVPTENRGRSSVRVREALKYAAIFTVCLVPIGVIIACLIQIGGLRQYLRAIDFLAYYTAGRLLLDGVSAGLYDLPTQYFWQRSIMPEVSSVSALLAFLNPPFVALMLAPLTLLSLESAYLVWVALNLVLLSLLCWQLVAAMGLATAQVKLRALIMCVTFVPTMVTIMQGQLSFWLALSLLLGWRALRCGHDMSGGLCLSLLLVKPQLVVIPALILAWKRRFVALSGLGLGGVVFLICSLWLVGPDGLRGYWRMLQAATGWGDAYGMHPQAMHTWRGFLHLLLGTDSAADVQVWWLLGVAGLLGLLIWTWRGNWAAPTPRFDLQWAVLIIVALLVSPHANLHDMSILLVCGVLAIRYLYSMEGHDTPKLAFIMSLLGYLVLWINVIWASVARVQFTVVFLLLATIWLVWVLRSSGERPAAKVAP